VRLRFFDAGGRLLRIVTDNRMPAGRQSPRQRLDRQFPVGRGAEGFPPQP